MSSLTDDYYDGSRQLQFLEIMQKYMKIGIPEYVYIIRQEDEMEGFQDLFREIREKYRDKEAYMLEYTKGVRILSTGEWFEYYYTDARGIMRYFRLDRSLVRGFKRAVDKKEIDQFMEQWDDRIKIRKVLEAQNITYSGPMEFIGYRLLTTGTKYKHQRPLIFLPDFPKVILSEEKYRRYLYHGIHLMKGEDHKEIYMKMNRDTVYDIGLYPPRETVDDGQLKIAVDVVLAFEEALAGPEETLRVLALGTSAPEGHRGGTAYELVPIMAADWKKDVIMDMYDPNEIEGEYNTDRVHISKFREAYQLTERDLENYDLLLDDVYTGYDSSVVFYDREWDPGAVYQRFKYFSIKGFEGSVIPRYKYRQVAKTNSLEFRSCSRRTKVRYSGEHRLLGSCAFCRELKYVLKFKYSRQFYRHFMKLHKYPCVPREVPKRVIEVFDKYELRIFDDFMKYHVVGDIYDDPRYITELTRKIIVELSDWSKYTSDLLDQDVKCVVVKDGYYECTHDRDRMIQAGVRAENYSLVENQKGKPKVKTK